MNKHDLNSIVENYINDLQYVLRESILKREIGRFPVDSMKAFFLLLPIVNEKNEEDNLRKITLSIGAIHAALDVHDRIESAHATSAEQQLTVLAGDHFSGIHYRILAGIGEFAFIRELSQTIAHINEQKTALHQERRPTASVLLERLKVIESGCISTFYNAYGFGDYLALTETVLTFVKLNGMANSEEQQAFVIDKSIIQQAMDILLPTLNHELEQISSLHPVLQQVIQEIVTPMKC
ncbi:heptaprenyl diphosphate synthase component 1 [Sporosarcina jeotgali]|uniref:Heptaprenyl diphosphate synthase component 1 n=1 Tax=Sporosarcina jeotgali TaxID=3020056 RepID=A0ABZ0L1A5_9BACL|nr:heptaprenyl diphosphate synthase component 1 [Sporosarcina sp. B2O-1]WOV85421.1 heptaprenyl diphosphate synthase component 1 [Sporosarcina sp. B2O-1]